MRMCLLTFNQWNKTKSLHFSLEEKTFECWIAWNSQPSSWPLYLTWYIERERGSVLSLGTNCCVWWLYGVQRCLDNICEELLNTSALVQSWEIISSSFSLPYLSSIFQRHTLTPYKYLSNSSLSEPSLLPSLSLSSTLWTIEYL